MIWKALATARSATDKWELKSLWNFLASSSKQSWESPISSPFRVIHGALPLGPIGSSKSVCQYIYESNDLDCTLMKSKIHTSYGIPVILI